MGTGGADMINSTGAVRGMAVAPHSLAAQSALAVLREGGNAIEAMVAAAATIAVVYPHMNSIGGDGFWLLRPAGGPAQAIDACGAAGRAATIDYYTSRDLDAIPIRGPLAANTVAGTISGWALALEISAQQWGGRLPLTRLLEDAIRYAAEGIPVTGSQAQNTRGKREELKNIAGFAARFLPDAKVPEPGECFVQKTLAVTLARLARAGLDDFYRGEIAAANAADLAQAGSPLAPADLAAHRAIAREPLALSHSLGTVYNLPPPTQGLVSLLILGIADRLGLAQVAPDSADHVHLLVEATKQAFLIRDRHITDPAYMQVDAQSLLAPDALAALAARVDRNRALPWGRASEAGDTVWMGVIDAEGRAVSFIQSIYHEFGSGVVLPGTGVLWQNRGCSFSLERDSLNALAPGRKPFHTLNPALAHLSDGCVMVYGAMGGEGQPQSQSAVFTRHLVYGRNVQQAITAPRWLLGRTWGRQSATLKLEARFDPGVIAELRARGHDVEVLAAFDETMGHAGAIVRHTNGLLEGGFDPRSDGGCAGF